jgi:hypothetical protein
VRVAPSESSGGRLCGEVSNGDGWWWRQLWLSLVVAWCACLLNGTPEKGLRVSSFMPGSVLRCMFQCPARVIRQQGTRLHSERQ